MEVTAQLNYLRLSAKKVRLVADLIRRKNVDEGRNILRFVNKVAAKPLLKLLESAAANARNNAKLDAQSVNNMSIVHLTVNQGPMQKRWMPRAHGAAYKIRRHTCHIRLVLNDKKL